MFEVTLNIYTYGNISNNLGREYSVQSDRFIVLP